jgi:hypothetical protein
MSAPHLLGGAFGFGAVERSGATRPRQITDLSEKIKYHNTAQITDLSYFLKYQIIDLDEIFNFHNTA